MHFIGPYIPIDISNWTRIDGIFHMVNIDRHIFLPFFNEKFQLTNHQIELASWIHMEKTMIRKFCFFFFLKKNSK